MSVQIPMGVILIQAKTFHGVFLLKPYIFIFFNFASNDLFFIVDLNKSMVF